VTGEVVGQKQGPMIPGAGCPIAMAAKKKSYVYSLNNKAVALTALYF